jgi:hypothetical protein
MRTARLIGLFWLMTHLAHTQAAPLKFQSSAERTTLLELYTSEGCSSCPPADAWLARLQDSAELWREFVPVAFHVDYWDHLGWRDPWGSREFSQRQRAYAQHWRRSTVYTPGFVINGEEWRDWSTHRRVPAAAKAKLGTLTVTAAGTNRWQASFVPAAPGQKRYEVYGALLACQLSSEVKVGENRGRRLHHDFVALTWVKAPLSERKERWDGEFAFNSVNQAATAKLALAVWVTRAGQLEPLQAVGGWLNQR